MFRKPLFFKPFEAYESVPGNGSLLTMVKNVAQKETRSSLYDLGLYVAENNVKTYTVGIEPVHFRVSELYGDKVLHAKKTEDESWTYVTKFDCN